MPYLQSRKTQNNRLRIRVISICSLSSHEHPMETLSITASQAHCCIKCKTFTEEMTQKTPTFRLQSFTYSSKRVRARTIRVHVVAEKNSKKNMFRIIWISVETPNMLPLKGSNGAPWKSGFRLTTCGRSYNFSEGGLITGEKQSCNWRQLLTFGL